MREHVRHRKAVALIERQASHALLVVPGLADDRLRSAGYGRRILEWFADEHPDLPLFLEIEPIDESAGNYAQRLRRLAFYQRNGFTVSNMLTHEAGQTFRVLHRGPGAGAISAERLEGELNAFGAGLVRSRVTTD